MDRLQFIVGRLAEEPFGIVVRAVDFDEKSPDELLQILNDVLATLSPKIKADVRVSPRDDVVDQMLQFLLLHKCDCIPSGPSEGFDDWVDGMRNGKKPTIYQLLQWVLREYEQLKKRVYLSQYLMPIDIPSEYFTPTNGNLEELSEALKELQAEFIEAHKHYESTMASVDRPTSDIIEDIEQMDAEEQQLLDRLERERAQTINSPNFQHLLAEASSMRKAQDDEIRLDQQKQKQMQQLAATKRKLDHTLEATAACEEMPVESILSELEDECRKFVNDLESNVIEKRHKAELKLLRAEKETYLSDKTEEGIEYIIEVRAQMEDKLRSKKRELDGLDSRNLIELSGLLEDLNDAAAKLRAGQEDAEAKSIEKELLDSTNEELRDSIKGLDGGDGPDGTTLSRDEFAEFQEHLARKLERYDDSKEEIAKAKERILELKHAKKAIEIQRRNLHDRFREEEERAGVQGFRDASNKLEHTSKQTASLNELKSQTLDDISTVVQRIANTLEEKKQELEPKVCFSDLQCSCLQQTSSLISITLVRLSRWKS
ncbi:hypothetical protein ACHAWF_017406 [Thalassiosira exigua]